MITTTHHKKAVISQRWPRDAPYIWVPWNFSALPDYAHGYFSTNFPWAVVPIDPVNVRTKFEVRSFTRSWDNRGSKKNSGSLWLFPHSVFPKRPSIRTISLCAFVFAQFSIGVLGGSCKPPILGKKGRRGRGWHCSTERWWVPICSPVSIVTFPLSLRVSKTLPLLCSSTPLFPTLSSLPNISQCSPGSMWMVFGLWRAKVWR